MMKVVCFGDSNTYGFDPRSFFGSRYPADSRWVDILANKTGWDVRNEGMNGREVPRNAVVFPENIRLLIIMLGTNDLLMGRSVAGTAAAMDQFLKALSLSSGKVLLIAPPHFVRGEWLENDRLVWDSHLISEEYRSLASQLGIRFVDSADWEIPLCFDGVHFTEEGHRRFAAGLYEYLQKENVLCLKSE